MFVLTDGGSAVGWGSVDKESIWWERTFGRIPSSIFWPEVSLMRESKGLIFTNWDNFLRELKVAGNAEFCKKGFLVFLCSELNFALHLEVAVWYGEKGAFPDPGRCRS